MANGNNNNAFLNLLKPENLQKIKIDAELIPAFKEVISKISDYFMENGLMDAKDWNAFFDEYLLNDGPNKHTIMIKDKMEVSSCAHGEYLKEKKELHVINKLDKINAMIATLCHEFIHFLVMADSNSLSWTVSSSDVLNEGMTELLTMKILYGKEFKTSSSYLLEIGLSEYYCDLASDKEPFKEFLNDRYVFDNVNAQANISRYSQRYFEKSEKSAIEGVQWELMNSLIDFYSVDTFDAFMETVDKINRRPFYDYDRASGMFERLTDTYMENTGVPEEKRENMKMRLMELCILSNKAHLYKDTEVAELELDGVHIALGRDGHSYNEFPLSGPTMRGQISFDGKVHTIINKDKKYEFDVRSLEYKNWNEIYNNYLSTFNEFRVERPNTTNENEEREDKIVEELKSKIEEAQNSNDYKTAAELKTLLDIIMAINNIAPSQRDEFIEAKLAELYESGNYETRAYWVQALAIMDSKNEKKL